MRKEGSFHFLECQYLLFAFEASSGWKKKVWFLGAICTSSKSARRCNKLALFLPWVLSDLAHRWVHRNSVLLESHGCYMQRGQQKRAEYVPTVYISVPACLLLSRRTSLTKHEFKIKSGPHIAQPWWWAEMFGVLLSAPFPKTSTVSALSNSAQVPKQDSTPLPGPLVLPGTPSPPLWWVNSSANAWELYHYLLGAFPDLFKLSWPFFLLRLLPPSLLLPKTQLCAMMRAGFWNLMRFSLPLTTRGYWSMT